MQQLQLMRMHLLQHLRRGLRIIATVADVVFLIMMILSVNSAFKRTFNPFYYFAESICVGCVTFQTLLTMIGNSTCMICLLTEPFFQAAVYSKDFTRCLISHVLGGQALACDKVAQNDLNHGSAHCFERSQCGSYVDIVTAGFCHTLPVLAEAHCDNTFQNILTSPKDALAPASAEVIAAEKEKTPPTCLLVKCEDRVRFEKSVPSYIPAELNGGRSGHVIMRPLHEPVRSHAVFGGPMTHHMDRYGSRVRKHKPRRGTVCQGKVSCDTDGRINARILNNGSLKAVAAAKNLFHEVYGRSATFQRSAVTNAIVKMAPHTLNWIADTGASMDFIGKMSLSKDDKNKLVKMNDPKRCNTGNGAVTISHTIKSTWGDGQKACAWVMPGDAPPCISVGQKCLRQGWGYYWNPFSQTPIMINPQGTCYKMAVNRNVPALPGEDDRENIYPVSPKLIKKLNAILQAILQGGSDEQFHHVDGAGGEDSERKSSEDAIASASAPEPRDNANASASASSPSTVGSIDTAK